VATCSVIAQGSALIETEECSVALGTRQPSDAWLWTTCWSWTV